MIIWYKYGERRNRKGSSDLGILVEKSRFSQITRVFCTEINSFNKEKFFFFQFLIQFQSIGTRAPILELWLCALMNSEAV